MAWLKPKGAAKHAGVSESTIRHWLKEGLVHSRLPSGTILIKQEWIDTYLEDFKVAGDVADQIADAAIRDF